ncbi:GntR family transcriptional regulator [Enemella evansiae]|uniref:GntR family transcriptional regulator n=1 Tax=Enemella evansiae TaxID=2016499 RepID=UPI0010EE97E1|nr:GntR family transcriptional regulator [Enemella evansiae]TDO89866.1 GntR family transcriptional regulator [Enemella evansiae]
MPGIEDGSLQAAPFEPTVVPIVPPTTKRSQVRELLEQIIAGRLRPGDAIASERELVRQLGVSRVTVRQAISDLVEAGRLERVHGKGTYVTGPRINTRLHLTSFSREMRARGLEPRTEVLSADEVAEPDELVREQLQLPAGQPVIRVERLRLADDTPMAHEIGFYPAHCFPGLLTRELGSLYDVFAADYDIRVTSGVQSIRAEAADQTQATVLGIARRAPLLVQERVTWAGTQVIEFATSSYRGDRYRIHMSVTPTGSS